VIVSSSLIWFTEWLMLLHRQSSLSPSSSSSWLREIYIQSDASIPELLLETNTVTLPDKLSHNIFICWYYLVITQLYYSKNCSIPFRVLSMTNSHQQQSISWSKQELVYHTRDLLGGFKPGSSWVSSWPPYQCAYIMYWVESVS